MTRAKTIAVLYSGGRQWGGIETYLYNLFSLADRARLDLVLLSLGEWELTRRVAGLAPESVAAGAVEAGRGDGPMSPVLDAAGGPRSRVLSGKRFRLRTIWDIRRVVREERAALLVSQGVVANAYARLAAGLAGVPNLVIVHSDLANDYPNPLRRWLYQGIDRLLRPLTDRYVTVAEYLKERLVKTGIEPAKVRVVRNGLVGPDDGAIGRNGTGPLGPNARPPKDEDEPLGWVSQTAESCERTNTVTLVTMGRLHPVKNFAALVEAMSLLPEEVRLEIWGSGPEETGLRGLIRARALEDRVTLCGEAAAVAEVLERADVYVQPSKSEGCSYAVLEAMRAGRPVVVTPCGGLPEQVWDGRTGIVAAGTNPRTLAAAIERLLADRSFAAQLGEAGREAVRRDFSLGRWLEETTAAFLEAAR